MRLSALGLLFLTTTASAETRWGLRWRAPESCIQPAELARAVESRLGRAVFGPEPQLEVDGQLSRGDDGKGWQARLTLVDDKGSVLGSREVNSAEDNCRAIDASLALVLAVMIDPAASLRRPLTAAPAPPLPPPPDPSPAPPPPPPVTPPPLRWTPAPAGAPVDPEEARPHQSLVGVRGAVGVSPQLAVGLDLGLQLSVSPSLRLDLRLPLYPYLPLATDTASGFLSGLGAGLALGWSVTPDRLSRWAWVAGAGVEWSGFLTHASSVGSGYTQVAGVLSALGHLRVHRRLGPRDAWGLQVQLDAGWAVLASTVRLVAGDGKPVDLPMGPFRLGLSVAFTSPFG